MVVAERGNVPVLLHITVHMGREVLEFFKKGQKVRNNHLQLLGAFFVVRSGSVDGPLEESGCAFIWSTSQPDKVGMLSNLTRWWFTESVDCGEQGE